MNNSNCGATASDARRGSTGTSNTVSDCCIRRHRCQKKVADTRAQKLSGRCASHAEDFDHQPCLYDIVLARELTSLPNMANSKGKSPDEFASRNQSFSRFWEVEQAKLEEMCRQHNEMPHLFFSVAPAEWSFPPHAVCSAI